MSVARITLLAPARGQHGKPRFHAVQCSAQHETIIMHRVHHIMISGSSADTQHMLGALGVHRSKLQASMGSSYSFQPTSSHRHSKRLPTCLWGRPGWQRPAPRAAARQTGAAPGRARERPLHTACPITHGMSLGIRQEDRPPLDAFNAVIPILNNSIHEQGINRQSLQISSVHEQEFVWHRRLKNFLMCPSLYEGSSRTSKHKVCLGWVRAAHVRWTCRMSPAPGRKHRTSPEGFSNRASSTADATADAKPSLLLPEQRTRISCMKDGRSSS